MRAITQWLNLYLSVFWLKARISVGISLKGLGGGQMFEILRKMSVCRHELGERGAEPPNFRQFQSWLECHLRYWNRYASASVEHNYSQVCYLAPGVLPGAIDNTAIASHTCNNSRRQTKISTTKERSIQNSPNKKITNLTQIKLNTLRVTRTIHWLSERTSHRWRLAH